MSKSGHYWIDGDPARGWVAATPRHWLICAAFVIVAQWLLNVSSALTNFVTFTAVGLDSGFGSGGALHAFASVAWLIFPYALIGVLTIALSARFDKRDAAAIGLHRGALLGSAPLILVGLIASAPILLLLLRLPPGWEGPALAALPWLIPATIIQAGAEEVLFRGVILACLIARYGPLNGALLSAAMFALWHAYVGQTLLDLAVTTVTTFMFGVTAAVLVLHQGHLGGAVALHVVWNVVRGVRDGSQAWDGFSTNDFWQSFLLQASQTTTLEYVASVEGRLELWLPLLLEAMIVFALCRTTVLGLFEER